MVFELLPQPRIIVVYGGRGEPRTEEWDGYVQLLGSLPDLERVRIFAYSEGGRATRTQQQALMNQLGDRDVAIAVVTASVAVRFVVSVFALINRSIKVFAPDHLDQALAHIRCTSEESLEVRGTIERLKAKLESGRSGGTAGAQWRRPGGSPESRA